MIASALTKEEWADGTKRVWRDASGKREFEWACEYGTEGVTVHSVTLNEVSIVTPKSRHAVAALCLYNQSFGFTREDVDILRSYAKHERSYHLKTLADRIEALLPPE